MRTAATGPVVEEVWVPDALSAYKNEDTNDLFTTPPILLRSSLEFSINRPLDLDTPLDETNGS